VPCPAVPLSGADIPARTHNQDVRQPMKTGKRRSERGVNGVRKTRIKSAQMGRFCAGRKHLFMVMVTRG
jgi:hypothetical protein